MMSQSLIDPHRKTIALVTQHEIEQWLQEGVIAAKAGYHEQARFQLLDVVEQDQTNETAWFWLYQVFDRHDDKRICLENLLTINPDNEWARQELLNYLDPAETARFQAQATQNSSLKTKATASRPITLKLVSAFWLGISIIFLGGGIIASGEWLISGLRTRTFPNYITAIQTFELLIAIIFIIVGIMGLNVAAGLFAQSIAGFYGSLLLALGLLLAGPTISLIADPPNYLSLVCTGGVSGMIVLLTLASHPAFSDTRRENDKSVD
jgi:tetratricopeptide (TPR) repeat protein